MSITKHLAATVNGHPEPIRISLRWDSRCPFEVHMDIYTSRKTVPWKFAVDLIAAGLLAPAGSRYGDIRIEPDVDPNGTRIVLYPARRVPAVLVVSTAELEAFLRETWVAEPPPLPDYIPAEFFEATS